MEPAQAEQGQHSPPGAGLRQGCGAWGSAMAPVMATGPAGELGRGQVLHSGQRSSSAQDHPGSHRQGPGSHRCDASHLSFVKGNVAFLQSHAEPPENSHEILNDSPAQSPTERSFEAAVCRLFVCSNFTPPDFNVFAVCRLPQRLPISGDKSVVNSYNSQCLSTGSEHKSNFLIPGAVVSQPWWPVLWLSWDDLLGWPH